MLLLEDVDLVCTKLSVNSSNHVMQQISRCQSRFLFFTCQFFVFSGGSSAELTRCASLDRPGTTISSKLSH